MRLSVKSGLFVVLIMSSIPALISCKTRSAALRLQWTKIATLKASDGSNSPGFAGAVNGTSNGVLLVAGGANFPEKKPWEGGKKHYSEQVHVLRPTAEGWKWSRSLTLPEPIAYCGIVTTPEGVLYAGGENDDGLSDRVYHMIWDKETQNLTVTPLPHLPKPLTNVGLGILGSLVFAVGGDETATTSDRVYCLELNTPDPEWKEAPPLPVPLANALVLATGNTLYVIGGRSKNTSGISTLNAATYGYTLSEGSWKRLADVSDGQQRMHLSAAAGVVIAPDLLLVTGGDNGTVFHQIETLLSRIPLAETAGERTALTAAKNKLITRHQGFYRSVLLYDIAADQWKKLGDLPFPAPVTTNAFRLGEQIILSNGEIKPGIRTPDIWSGTVVSGND